MTYRKIFYNTNIYRDITCVGVFAPWICKLLHFVDFVVPTVQQDHYRWANCKAKWSEIMKYFSGPVWLHCLISNPIKASRYLGMWLDLTTSHRQTWLFSCTSTYHSWPHVALPTWSSTEQLARPATKWLHTSDWRPLEKCCRPWTWWCLDATALAGYANMMTIMMK